MQLTFTLTVTDTTGATGTDTVTITVAGDFFSGYITGPDWCTNHSLGGPRTYAHDSQPKDGVADVCSLPYTRREAIARQSALITLASLDSEGFLAQVRLACRQLTGSYDDGPADLASDVCASGQLSEPPAPLAEPRPKSSTRATSPAPTGVPTTAWAVLAPMPTTASPKMGCRRVLAALHPQRGDSPPKRTGNLWFPLAVFNSAVALACRQLGSTTFEGDAEADLERDICS